MSHPNEPSQTQTRNTNTNGRAPQSEQRPAPNPEEAAKRRKYLAEQYGYTPDQIDVVRNAICVAATDAELEFFLATAKRVKLDPFARQIWFVKRRQKIEDAFGNESWVDVGRPETSIDGYRTIAERSGQYRGQAAMLWCGDDGKWLDVWLKDKPPAAAKATIVRGDFNEPLTNVAIYEEFCPKYKNGKSPTMWLKMPANQLAKCAEAGGFRRAFPQDLSGLVTDTEMEHVDVSASFSAPPIATAPQRALDQRKPDRPAEIVSSPPVEAREAAPVERAAQASPEQTTAAPAASGDETPGVDENPIEAEIARLLREVAAAKSRDDLQSVGKVITETKKRAVDERDDFDHLVLTKIEPALQAKWRELVPTKRGQR